MHVHTMHVHTEITFDESSTLRAATLLEAEINGVRKLAQAVSRQGHYERSNDLYLQARRLSLVLDLLREGL